MRLLIFFLLSLCVSTNILNAESRFGDLTEMRDDRMRGKDNQWVRPHPGPFVWNNIEKEKGIFSWDKADEYVIYAQNHNQNTIATIWPYSNWEQKTCKRKKGRSPFGKRFAKYLSKPCSMESYEKFLLALVDRYDGDGINDMPSLTKPIIHWEIMNEPEFKMFFKGTEDEFVEIFNFSSKLIKSKQKNAVIIMAGAAGMFPESKKFWKSALPKIKDHFDIANMHHITPPDGKCDKDFWVGEFSQLLQSLNIDKPIWVTEAMTGVCRVIPSYINTFVSGAEVIIDVGANAPGMKMSKKSRKKLNNFIREVDGFKSVKLISKKQAEFFFEDGSTKIIDFKKMKIEGKEYRTIWFENNTVKIIDQTKLPHRFIIKDLKTVNDAINAIKSMEVRGAPLIGATAAYGLVLAIKENNDQSFLKKAADNLISSRPTAINLKWAVDRMMNRLSGVNSDKILEIASNEAKEICEEDVKFCENIGLNGLKIIEEIYNKKKNTINILTHCNAGWLATVNWGTATSPIYHAHKKGIPVHVWADETRPRNQGANLTSYELNEEGIKNTIIADNTGGILMQRGEVDICIVGTDRTLANGDVCNKVGTYLKALAAHDNDIPFYVALPSSTIDWNIKNHKDIPIEERNSEELSRIEGLDENGNVKKIQIYPKKSKAMNLAFDVTPAKYVTGLITEKGICKASKEGLKKLFK